MFSSIKGATIILLIEFANTLVDKNYVTDHLEKLIKQHDLKKYII